MALNPHILLTFFYFFCREPGLFFLLAERAEAAEGGRGQEEGRLRRGLL